MIPWGLGPHRHRHHRHLLRGLARRRARRARRRRQYLLETANKYFPDAKLTPDDVLATWSGMRPLVEPAAKDVSASKVCREHMVESKPPGFIAIAGGKLTTYRAWPATWWTPSSGTWHSPTAPPPSLSRCPAATPLPRGRVAAARRGRPPTPPCTWCAPTAALAPGVGPHPRGARPRRPLVPGLPYLAAEAARGVTHELVHTCPTCSCAASRWPSRRETGPRRRPRRRPRPGARAWW